MSKDKPRKNKISGGADKASTPDERDARGGDEAAEPDSRADENTLRPYSEKIGEGQGNLRRREEWFQKRTGKS